MADYTRTPCASWTLVAAQGRGVQQIDTTRDNETQVVTRKERAREKRS